MDPQLTPLNLVLERTDERLRSGADHPTIWPTGFGALDDALSGGLRSGSLLLLAGAQGAGKTTFALQMARNAAASGHTVVYFTYEHDAESMLERLIAMEAGILGDMSAPGLNRVREAFEADDPSLGGLAERLSDTSVGAEAVKSVESYGHLMHIHRSTGTTTSMEVIRAAVEHIWETTGEPPMVVVDYLQKVKADNNVAVEDERVTEIVEGLKDLAIAANVPVVSIVAADKSGLETGKRMRAQHLRGSTALAYEADILLMLNNKFDLVSRHHLVYAMGNVEQFKQMAVVSIEKNRHGFDGIDLEFKKRFAQSRFDTNGNRVMEQLVDDRVFTE
ncbi:putative DnaB domain protein helicase domain protein [metagenome]|uniref:Putative DnaB domain protein helicase domain protein n=1 Tax=metagenome TaxID=256318 RepID=A0A2P2C640_9ZZZZ